jgi:hypothetical protein
MGILQTSFRGYTRFMGHLLAVGLTIGLITSTEPIWAALMITSAIFVTGIYKRLCEITIPIPKQLLDYYAGREE